MINLLGIILLILFLSFVAGLTRIIRGPTRYDRMMAAQLFGTTGVAILLLISLLMRHDFIVDIALIFALLATVTVVAFVQRSPDKEDIDINFLTK